MLNTDHIDLKKNIHVCSTSWPTFYLPYVFQNNENIFLSYYRQKIPSNSVTSYVYQMHHITLDFPSPLPIIPLSPSFPTPHHSSLPTPLHQPSLWPCTHTQINKIYYTVQTGDHWDKNSVGDCLKKWSSTETKQVLEYSHSLITTLVIIVNGKSLWFTKS